MKPNDELDKEAPRGETAIPQPLDENTEAAMMRERGVEAMREIMDRLSKGEDFAPVMFARKDGQIVAIPLEVKDGVFIVPDLNAPSPAVLREKKKRVKRIMKRLDKTLRRDIGEVTEIALLRKDPEKLREIELKLKEGKKPSLRNRIGCIFLEVGGESVQI